MNKSKFSEEQIAYVLRQVEACRSTLTSSRSLGAC